MSPELARHIALDARLVEAVSGIRLLQAVSWPAREQQRFLESFRRGEARLPQPEYRPVDLSAAREALAGIRDTADPQHPLGQYLQRNAESWLHAAWLIEAAGSEAASWHSIQLFGRPGDALPGSTYTNIDAARHFIEIADEVSGALVPEDSEDVYSAEAMAAELQAALDAFFVGHRVRVEVDPELIAKAAAGPTRIRLRGGATFSEYDLRQLLEHEAFVHSLTALNGREQPHIRSLSRSAPRVTATQEGLATFAELMTGAIDLPRLKRLSLRILAIDMALSGADFIEVFRFFLDSGQSEVESFASAQRVFRGCPTSGGSAFTKDAVYLHGMLSVHTFFRWTIRHRRPRLSHLLFAGKMALHDVFTLEPLFEEGVIAEPLYLPPWAQRANGLAGVLAFSLFANRIRIDRVEAEDLTLGL
jgi:uncharacterized protein (TIGR02421 family)